MIHKTIPYLLILAITFFVWQKNLGQVPIGEGYMYFSWCQRFFIGPCPNFNLSDYNNFARLMFSIFPLILKDNIQSYLLLQLILMVLLYWTIYFCLYRITKSKLIGFLTTIFFGTNYFGSFEMMVGNYQRFAERVVNLIPMIFAFLFLERFLSIGKIKYFIITLCLFSLGIFLGHFSSFLIPLFVIYPVVDYLIDKDKSFGKLVIRISLIGLFFLINYLLTFQAQYTPKIGLFTFLQTESNLIKKVIYQIPAITIPHELVKFIAGNLTPPVKYPFTSLLGFLVLPTLLFYGIGLFMVIKFKPQLNKLYLTVFLSMISIMLLYIYIDPRLDILSDFSQGRGFFLSSMLASICWAIFLHALPIKKIFLKNLVIFIIVISYIMYNTNLIWSHSDSLQYQSEAMRKVINYAKYKSSEFKDDSIVVMPSYILWPASFISFFYTNGKTEFILASPGWEKKFQDKRDKVFVFDYDYERTSQGYDPKKGRVVDFTNKFRFGQKIDFLND